MVRHLEAIFEDGVLRPLEPLSLAEHQHVRLTIEDTEPSHVNKVNHRYAEAAWLQAHKHDYAGQWVALEGDRLLAHGPEAVPVRDEARRLGVKVPFMHHLPQDDAEAQAFWL